MKTRALTRSALLVGVMLILGYVESLLPSGPVPGLKLGLSNGVLLWALYRLGFPASLGMMFAKVLLSALLFGSPSALIYSLAGGLSSLLVMTPLTRARGVSPVGAGMAGAATHNAAQVLAAMLVTRTPALWYYMALLLPLGAATGAATGALCAALRKSLPNRDKPS